MHSQVDVTGLQKVVFDQISVQLLSVVQVNGWQAVQRKSATVPSGQVQLRSRPKRAQIAFSPQADELIQAGPMLLSVTSGSSASGRREKRVPPEESIMTSDQGWRVAGGGSKERPNPSNGDKQEIR